jgi:hypothetical protein
LNEIEEAILRTILYADVFYFPMTAREIHHFLIADTPTSLQSIEEALTCSPRLARLVETDDIYFARAGRSDLIRLRIERERASHELWSRALFYGRWLARLPFVRMVALTGALAMRNAANARDDVDYVLVTAEHRVWLARAFAIVLVRLGRLRGITLCPNYVLAEGALEQERHDLFIAHEVAQMVPISGFDVYHTMRDCNRWVSAECRFHLPSPTGILDRRVVGRAEACVRIRARWWIGHTARTLGISPQACPVRRRDAATSPPRGTD